MIPSAPAVSPQGAGPIQGSPLCRCAPTVAVMEYHEREVYINPCPGCGGRFRYPVVPTHQPQYVFHHRGRDRKACRLGHYLHPGSGDFIVRVIPDHMEPIQWLRFKVTELRALAKR